MDGMNLKRVRSWHLGVVLPVAALAAVGCSEDVTGPKPAIEPPSQEASPPPVEPPIICNAQLTSEVTLHGEDFSPVPIDIPNDPKVALPDITLTRSHAIDGSEVGEPEVVLYSGDADADTTNTMDADGEPLVSWDSQQQMRFRVNQGLMLPSGDEGMLAQGVYDVTVENANGDKTESLQSLAVVDKPSIGELSPGVVCLEQGERTITLTGESFLRNGSDQVMMHAEDVDAPFAVVLPESDCTAVANEGVDAEICTTADVTLAMDSIAVGFPALNLHNPETAACTTEEDIKLRVVRQPVIDRVVEPMGCVAQGERVFVIEGADFLRIDDVPPVVTVGDTEFAVDSMDCEDDEFGTQDRNKLEQCSAITITVGEGELSPDLYTVVVDNPQPAGCTATATGALRIVAPPAVTQVQPPLVCLDNGARDIVVLGTDFLTVDGVVPMVVVDGNTIDEATVVPAGCAAIEPEMVDGPAVEVCTELTVTVPEAGAAIGLVAVSVTNPDPAGCSDERADLLEVVAGPEIDDVQPALVCAVDGMKSLTISGSQFLRIDGAAPVVTIGGTPAALDAMNCVAPRDVNGLSVETCDSIDVTVAMGALPEGQPEVMVENPGPAGCMAARSDLLTVPPALELAAASPANICQFAKDPAYAVTLTGAGFLRVDGADPTLTFGGGAFASVDYPVDDCQDLAVDGQSVSTCSTIETTVDLSGAETDTLGPIEIAIDNSHVAECPLTDTIEFNVVEPPRVDLIDIVGADVDDQVCDGVGLVLVLTGDNFADGAIVTLTNNNMTITSDPVVVDTPMQITATFAGGLPFDDDTTWDLLVDNGGGCADGMVDAINVNPNPLVFFVDPPVVYNEVSIDATIFASGLSVTSALDFVEVIDGAGTATVLCNMDGMTGPGDIPDCDNPRANRIIANIPGELGNPTFTAGDYEVHVTTTIGCETEIPGNLAITATKNDALLTSIEPSYVSPSVPTPVTVNGMGFLQVPRLYLTPVGMGKATALRAVEMSDTTRLTAVVPAGVTPGVYHLILVNADGEVALLDSAVTVTVGEPPVITSVVPASLVANSISDITLIGANFDDAVAPVIELECLSGATITGTAVATPDTNTATATFDTSAVSGGDVCLARLINPDGSFFEFSAVSITNGSLNLGAWSAESAMTTGRRALSLEAGRPTNTSRFVYAIGGDSGTAVATEIGSTVHDTVESVPVDLFGSLGSWSLQRNTMSPRTWAGSARIGRFIYVTGGHDGNGATDTLQRAQILDPLATPDIADLDAIPGDPVAMTGHGEGLLYYRVAAVFPADDPSNPSGEGLAGEVLPVDLPATPDGIVLTLTWEEITGASGYRIYRSPAADASVDQMELLTEVTCGVNNCDCGADIDGVLTLCPVRDDGTGTTDANETPMPTGSLGAWHTVGGPNCGDVDCLLETARESHATVAVEDPAAAGTYYLYAFGGRDGGGAELDSYEVATVTVNALTGEQTVGDWVQEVGALSVARAELGAFVMTSDNAKAISDPADVWIYVGPGRAGNGLEAVMDVSMLIAGGSLGNPLATVDMSDQPGQDAGYGYGAANDQLFIFGGAGGAPSSNGGSAKLCGGPGSPGGCDPGPPDLEPGAWNGLGSGAPLDPRIYAGSTQESAFFFLCGGHDGAAALDTTERTVQ